MTFYTWLLIGPAGQRFRVRVPADEPDVAATYKLVRERLCGASPRGWVEEYLGEEEGER